MQVVDFDYDAIDLVVEFFPTVLPLSTRGYNVIDRLDASVVRVGLKTPLEKGFEHLPLRARLPTFSLTQGIDEHVEWAPGRNPRIKLAHRPRGAVARIGEQRLTASSSFVVDLLKCGSRQVHLAAHFHMWRRLSV